MGCYLDDLCLEPANHLDDTARVAARVEGQERLAEHVRILQPRTIIVVMVAIADNVARAAREAGQGSVPPLYVLPFPGRRAHCDRYVAELTAIVKRLSTERIFLRGRR